MKFIKYLSIGLRNRTHKWVLEEMAKEAARNKSEFIEGLILDGLLVRRKDEVSV